MKKILNSPFLVFTIFLLLSSTAYGEINKYKLKDINDVGWRVFFIKSTHNSASYTTTFHYLVGVENWEDNLHQWTFEFQRFTKPKIRSTESFNLLKQSNGNIIGISWNQKITSGSVKRFSVTVDGLVAEQRIPFFVSGKNYIAKGFVTGPGSPMSSIAPNNLDLSGTIYLDINKKIGTLSQHDIKLSQVTVLIYDDQHQKVGKQLTNENGEFKFRLKKGKYYIIVPTYLATRANQFLNDFTTATKRLIHPINLSKPINKLDIGFKLNSAAILTKIAEYNPNRQGSIALSNLDWRIESNRQCLLSHLKTNNMVACLDYNIRKSYLVNTAATY